MSLARHRATARSAARTRLGKLTGLAVLSTTATATVVAVGVAGVGPQDSVEKRSSAVSAGAAIGTVDLDRLAESRQERASRTARRITLEPQPVGHRFATAPLNVWKAPREKGPRVGLLAWGTKVAVTGQVVGHWAEVLLEGGKVRWVNADYLARRKPKPEQERSGTGGAAVSGVSEAPCPDGSGTEAGLTSGAVRLYRAVCAAFPALTTYGGYDGHGEHADGRAIDFMVSDSSLGQAVADWVLANAAALGVRDIIWAQRIWTPDRASEGWRPMSDRGSATANHYDHVHVAVY